MKRPENPAARERFDRLLDVARKYPDQFVAHLGQCYAAGQRNALADMIYYCACLGWALPQWAAEAFATDYQRFRRGELKSWDGVLGKRGHLRSLKASSHGFSVWALCRQLHDDSPDDNPIDGNLFETVGAKFGIHKTKCYELYYQQERLNQSEELKEAIQSASSPETSARK